MLIDTAVEVTEVRKVSGFAQDIPSNENSSSDWSTTHLLVFKALTINDR